MSAPVDHPNWQCTSNRTDGQRCHNYISLKHPDSHRCSKHQKLTADPGRTP